MPARKTRGPLAFDLPESRLPADRAAWYADAPLTGVERFEIVNFVGWGSVTDIQRLVSAEFGWIPVETVGRYLDDLVTAGVIGWDDGQAVEAGGGR